MKYLSQDNQRSVLSLYPRISLDRLVKATLSLDIPEIHILFNYIHTTLMTFVFVITLKIVYGMKGMVVE
jgi:hypothetical protein